MSTKIFANYSAFLSRKNKDDNGADKDFAELYPDFEKQNETNTACWNCSGCSGCSDCSRCSRCSDCSRCSGCSDCSDCSDCSNIAYLRLKENLNPASTAENPVKGFPDIPVIENIHQKVYEAVQQPEALNMGDWHTCDTTHCRAGWVVFLAGAPGKELEGHTSTQFAAMQIYKASSPEIRVSPVRFFETNEVALADIKACAEKEIAETQPK